MDLDRPLVIKRRNKRGGKRTRRSNEAKSARWSSILPNDVLLLISHKIITSNIKDYFSFTAACRSWHSFATDPTNKPLASLGPLYMSWITEGSISMMFKYPSSDQTLTLALPEPTGSFLWGSPFGWLITNHSSTFRISLLNPFTRASFALPEFPYALGLGCRAYLTASPDSDPENCLLVVVVLGYINKLAFVKPDRGRWDYLQLLGDSDFYGVTYFKGNLYGLRSFGHRCTEVACFRLMDGCYCLAHVAFLPRGEGLVPVHNKYLVDLDGQLCLCVRYYHYMFIDTVDFKFFAIDVLTGKLSPVVSLGDCCVYLDCNYSFAYKARYPRDKLFKRHEHASDDEFVSNYVFYNDNEVGRLRVWDMLHSCEVFIRNVPSSALWMLLPFK